MAVFLLSSWLVEGCDEPDGSPTDTDATSAGSTGADEPVGTTESPGEGSGGSGAPGDATTETTDGAGETSGGSSGSSGGEAEPPEVDTFPGGADLVCGNQVLPFTPPLDLVGPTPEDAYWMMWFARRTPLFGQPQVPAELATIGFDDYVEIEVPAVSLQAFVAAREDAVVVAFRGSQDVTDWLVNFSFAQVDGDLYDLPGRVHLGFSSALAAAWEPLVSAVQERAAGGVPVWVTGHSLGGAMATLAAARFLELGLNVAPVYVFGQPRAGDQEFADAMQIEFEERFYRFANGLDVVPRVPPAGESAAAASAVLPFGGGLTEPLIAGLDYAHLGTLHRFEDGAVVIDPPMDDSNDVTYWEALDAAGWLALITATQQGTWHSHDEYLCHLRQWAFGG